MLNLADILAITLARLQAAPAVAPAKALSYLSFAGLTSRMCPSSQNLIGRAATQVVRRRQDIFVPEL